MNKEIYLDNCSTTPLYEEVIKEMNSCLTDYFGNPSSLHKKGLKAEKELKKSRATIASILDVNEEEIYFTSGGTEANNLAIKGITQRHKRKGKHVITTQIEHPSVFNTMTHLNEKEFDVTFLAVDKQGFIDLEELKESLRTDTILVSIMHANNEVGTIQDLEKIGELIKKKNPKTLFHVDAVQSFCKIECQPQKWQADLLSMSSHKIHGPKGSGALYIRKGILIDPLFHGGSQEKEIRPGTENMPGIVGFAKAAKLYSDKAHDNYQKTAILKSKLIDLVKNRIENITINTPKKDCLPNVANITFGGLKGETLVHALAQNEIYVSTGSACHSKNPMPSHVLVAMGRDEKQIEGTIRFSFSEMNELEDIEFVANKLEEIVSDLRMFQ